MREVAQIRIGESSQGGRPPAGCAVLIKIATVQQNRLFSSVVRATFSRANHRLCAAHFRFSRVGRRVFAFPCFGLPRRHRSTTRTTLDCRSERLDDQLLGRFLSFVHVSDFLLGSQLFESP